MKEHLCYFCNNSIDNNWIYIPERIRIYFPNISKKQLKKPDVVYDWKDVKNKMLFVCRNCECKYSRREINDAIIERFRKIKYFIQDKQSLEDFSLYEINLYEVFKKGELE